MKILENMFESTTNVKRVKLDMIVSKLDNLSIDVMAQFNAKLCDISNECFALGKQYKDN